MRLQGTPRGTVLRRLAHEPLAGADRARDRRASLPVYRLRTCVAPGHHSGGRAAGQVVAPWAALGVRRDRGPAPHGREGRRRARCRVEHRQRRGPGRGKRVLIDDEHRFDGVKVIGVDEHVWRHTRRGDKYVTVIIDLTPVRDRTGPARLLDRSGLLQAGVQDLARRPPRRLARRGGGRSDGRLHRLQVRRGRGGPRCRRGHGPLSRGPLGRGCTRQVPMPSAARDPRPPRPRG